MSNKNLPLDQKLTELFDDHRRLFEPFISSIRFPHYKSLETETRIDFNWPITVLVGPNGTNKTSILHALAAAPAGKSIAEYWFSTKLDDIDRWGGGDKREQKKNPHRFIYSYGKSVADPGAECRKARVTRKFRGKEIPPRLVGKEDPDYWEPTKVAVSDGMRQFTPDPNDPLKYQQRWKLIEKPILFLDLKSEISAFDKFLNHSRENQRTNTATKKRIRAMSTAADLEKALNGTTRNKKIMTRIIEGPRDLDPTAVGAVSRILGKNVDSIRVIRHKLFGAPGTTFRLYLKTPGVEYSEAHAGSGEFTIVRLVDEILRAENGTLILLDEPETSLHPGAQERFMEFLVAQTLTKKLQVVLSTHSPAIVDCLPARAIKVLGFDNADSQVKLLAQACTPSEAFNALGFVPKHNTRFRIFLEDELSKELVEASMRRKRPTVKDMADIQIIPGGSGAIVDTVLPVLATGHQTYGESSVILLDGDEKSELFDAFLNLSRDELVQKITNCENPEKELEFEEIWKRCIHRTLPKLFIHGDKSNKDDNVERLFAFATERLGFIGDSWPEKILAEQAFPDDYRITINTPGFLDDENGEKWKEWWVEKTRDFNKLTDQETVSAQLIFQYQRACLNSLSDSNPLFQSVMNEVERVSKGLI